MYNLLEKREYFWPMEIGSSKGLLKAIFLDIQTKDYVSSIAIKSTGLLYISELLDRKFV